MARIQCLGCGKEISSEIKECPYCGAKRKAERVKKGRTIGTIPGLIIIALAVYAVVQIFANISGDTFSGDQDRVAQPKKQKPILVFTKTEPKFYASPDEQAEQVKGKDGKMLALKINEVFIQTAEQEQWVQAEASVNDEKYQGWLRKDDVIQQESIQTGMALTCHPAIRQVLVNPDSASFGMFDRMAGKSHDGLYVYKNKVTFKNSFNAKLTREFLCFAKHNPKAQYHFDIVQINGLE